MAQMRNFSRHTAVKAVSFFLLVGCVVAFTLTAFYLHTETRGGEYGREITLDDHLSGVSLENSRYLFRIASMEYDSFISKIGWYADNQTNALAQYKQNEKGLQNSTRVQFRVEAAYLTASNTQLSREQIGRNVTSRITEGMPTYEEIRWQNMNPDGYTAERYNDYEERNAGTVAFSLTNGYIEELRTQYERQGALMWRLAAVFILTAALAVLCLIHLLLTCGRAGGEALQRPYRENVKLSPLFDRPWLDVSLFAVIINGVLCEWVNYAFVGGMRMNNFNRSQIFSGVFTGLFAAVTLWWLLCAMKRIKDRSFLRHTLIYVIFSAIFRFAWKYGLKPAARAAGAFFSGLPLVWKSVIWAVAGLLLMLILFLSAAPYAGEAVLITFPLLLCAAVRSVYKSVRLAHVAKGLRRLAKGDYNTPVALTGGGVARQMARDLNAATDGLKIAVEKELTSQRMKNELITNVSHDLRTPLTSVITYADLLDSEGLDAPDAPKYLGIVRQKARRLQTLTEDLFEASKASSGETRAVPEALDLSQLIEQSLGEVGDRLRAVPLDVRVSGGCGAVLADGKMLCRVFENLLRNAEKYAMPGTRVYIDTKEEGANAVITLRNISAQPLEGGGTDRLFERFARGDEARSTEGSGLGLAIVKSFMELQNGSCALSADGDLFKVTLTLPLAAEPSTAAEAPAPPPEDTGYHPYRDIFAAVGNLLNRQDGDDS